MTQPPAQRPQDGQGFGSAHGYGGPPSQPPHPVQGPYGAPPSQRQSGGPNPYVGPPTSGQGLQPYGQPHYGPSAGYPVSSPPGDGGAKGKRLALIIGGAVVAVALVAGAVFFATKDDGGGTPVAGGSTSAAPTVSESPTDEPTVSESPTGEPTAEPTDEPTEEPTDAPGGAPATGFKGQWQSSEGKALNIWEKFTSGQYKGYYNCNWIASGDGILIGIGQDRSDGSFRIALAPMGSDDESKGKGGNLVRVGDSVKISWDKGGTDTLDWVG